MLTPDFLFSLANPAALLGWVMSRVLPQQATALTWTGAALYTGAVAGLFGLALTEQPLIARR